MGRGLSGFLKVFFDMGRRPGKYLHRGGWASGTDARPGWPSGGSTSWSLLEAGKVRVNGKEVGEFSFKRIVPEVPLRDLMPQPVFLAALLRKAEAFPSFHCLMGAKVTKLIQNDGVTVVFSGCASPRYGHCTVCSSARSGCCSARTSAIRSSSG